MFALCSRSYYPACWSTLGPAHERVGLLGRPDHPQYMLFNTDKLDWSRRTSGCTKLHGIAVHEAGHAYGFTHLYGESTMESVMGRPYEQALQCTPGVYDVVAMMANYQSRVGGEYGN